jgi:hypothetical protein
LYSGFTEIASDGLPIARVVAAVEGDDSVAPVPQHIVEYRECNWLTEAISGDTISIKSGAGRVVSGSVVDYACGEFIAEEIWADIGAS